MRTCCTQSWYMYAKSIQQNSFFTYKGNLFVFDLLIPKLSNVRICFCSNYNNKIYVPMNITQIDQIFSLNLHQSEWNDLEIFVFQRTFKVAQSFFLDDYISFDHFNIFTGIHFFLCLSHRFPVSFFSLLFVFVSIFAYIGHFE